jgi:ribosomal protein S18 acetylase RimI-like enzyme
MEFIESQNYEESVLIIKSEMIPYYADLDLTWDDSLRLAQYKECDLWSIHDEKIVGFAMTREDEEDIYLAELHISEKYRNNGYGKKSLQLAKELASSKGYSEIKVRVFKNSPAYELYLRSEFTMEKELPYTYQLIAKTHNKNGH